MTYDPSFDYLFNEAVTVEPAVGGTLSGYGDRTYGAAKTVMCRIEQRARNVVDRTGKETVSMTLLIVRPFYTDGSGVALTADDRITLPSGYSPSQPPIIDLRRQNDEGDLSGTLHHWEVYL